MAALFWKAFDAGVEEVEMLDLPYLVALVKKLLEAEGDQKRSRRRGPPSPDDKVRLSGIATAQRLNEPVFLLFAPVLMDLFIFPESHAVHPYLYDISMSVLGFMSFIFVIQALQADEKYTPQRWYPLVMVIFVGILIHNFTSLIRFFPRF